MSGDGLHLCLANDLRAQFRKRDKNKWEIVLARKHVCAIAQI